MVFSDLFFLFVFLPAFALSYLLARWLDRLAGEGLAERLVARNSVLVIFSLIFYAWGEPVYVFLMLGSVLVNYLAGLLISGRVDGWPRKAALAAGLACNLAILAVFKYAGFFAETLNQAGLPVSVPKIALPIGISFYTFQSISYLIDVYRRVSPVQKRLGNLLLYISMFPQLIAGPIVRYETVAHEISSRKVTAADVADGVYRFLIGLGKKVIIANQLSEVVDDLLVRQLHDLSTLGAWVGLLAFTLQIYFDFSGYSDMAIGMGRCMGFHFNENFDHPYCSRSITEFWRRWHISLGSFFRDYVYIPLGGNRRHQAVNILTVWFLTGMWHGASWNFIFWGLYYGLIVTIEKYTLLRVVKRVPAVLLHIYSLLLIMLGWSIFYYDDLSQMAVFDRALVGLSGACTDVVAVSALHSNAYLWLAAVVLCLPMRRWLETAIDCRAEGGSAAWALTATVWRVAVSVALLVMSVALLVGATNNAFIYTRF
ncbi:MAG: MBOAT family protein [Muribaculaceae bacterium]|nr:MBOAT family protein [Muribaculaceae bacterium]